MDYIYNYPEDFEHLTFPDGQLHVKAKKLNRTVTGDTISVNARIRNPNELFGLALAFDILSDMGYEDAQLNIWYLMAGRMDRAISDYEPNTLRVVCNTINNLELNGGQVNVFCPHSAASLNLLANGFGHEMLQKEVNFYSRALSIAYYRGGEKTPGIFVPDVEGQKRFYNKLHKNLHQREYGEIVAGNKKRDMETGKLAGFEVFAETVPENIVIIDDLVDGGGTFAGQAKILREKGAKFITLAVPHAILSKGPKIEGIDLIVTTDSYTNHVNDNIVCIKVSEL